MVHLRRTVTLIHRSMTCAAHRSSFQISTLLTITSPVGLPIPSPVLYGIDYHGCYQLIPSDLLHSTHSLDIILGCCTTVYSIYSLISQHYPILPPIIPRFRPLPRALRGGRGKTVWHISSPYKPNSCLNFCTEHNKDLYYRCVSSIMVGAAQY